MEFSKFQNAMIFLFSTICVVGYMMFVIGRPAKAPSEEARKARQEARRIVALFPTGGVITSVEEGPDRTMHYVVQREDGRVTANVVLERHASAPEWRGGCRLGDWVSLRVKDYPDVYWGDDTSSVDTLGYFLTPYCQLPPD